MKHLKLRRALLVLGLLLAALMLVILASVVAIDAGCCRNAVIKFAASQLDRSVQVQGSLQIQILSRQPWLIAERVTIGSPPWLPGGPIASIGKLILRLDPPRLGQPLSFARVTADEANFHLIRNAAGQANWRVTDRRGDSNVDLPIVHSLSIPNAQVEIRDDIRNLHFRGAVTVDELPGHGAAPSLRLAATGQLNDRPVTLNGTGDPLANASHTRPYAFGFSEESSGSRVVLNGTLLHPFAPSALNAQIEAAGDNLKDLYFLIGVHLPNTGAYRLSSRFERRGPVFNYRDLNIQSGQSDLRGEATIDTSGTRPHVEATLHSQLLRTADLGARAAGSETVRPALMLSTAQFDREAVLRVDATINYGAQRVQVGSIPLLRLSANALLREGVLRVSPVNADIYRGRLQSNLTIDARQPIPAADIDLQIRDLQLADVRAQKPSPSPVEGTLRARVTLHGNGSSIHAVAASGTGQLTAVVRRGAVRTAFAELAGLDLHGLGLLLAKNQQETPIRCGVASFDAHAGTLTAQTLLLDTEPVLITGSGGLTLSSEALDFEFDSHPKHASLLRVRSPVLLGGTLKNPAFTLQKRNTLAQSAAAVTLGVVLTPLAAILAFVDPGLAKDADCAALSTGADSK